MSDTFDKKTIKQILITTIFTQGPITVLLQPLEEEGYNSIVFSKLKVKSFIFQGRFENEKK